MTKPQSSDFAGDVHNYSLDFNNREIYLHGYIANCDEDPGVDYRMASSFIKNIRMMNVDENLNPSGPTDNINNRSPHFQKLDVNRFCKIRLRHKK